MTLPPEAFTPDLTAIAIDRAKGRVSSELELRIEMAFPTSQRLDMIAGEMARRMDGLSTDAARMVASEAEGFRHMVETISQLKNAAHLLRAGLDAGRLNPHKINVSSDTYWKTENDKEK